ncbi:MAG: hypothetical protein GY782_09595, partial [Gammaproteobacteria bacterium]|nr:hypothetical protein [Gammaproteobacteria bacterium]
MHLLLSIPPSIAVSKLLQYIKGKSGRKLLQEFEHLRTWSRYLGIDFGHPWPKSPRKRAAMFAAAVLVAAPAPARLKESGLRS